MSAQPVQPANELHVIAVDRDRLEIKVGSRADDIQNKLYQVSSEDARVLAINAAKAAGITTASIKHHGLQYGNDETGVVATNMVQTEDNPVHPFLVVKLAGSRTGGSGFLGDSNVY